jgi:glycosyltransferase involved in cell wall biosynthesis
MSADLDASAVTVVMAVRDGERYLAEAIDSILHQTTPPGEIVVVDDGSTDRTMAILGGYEGKVRVVHQPPTGQFAAMNLGIAVAAGELLAFLDADDLYPSSSIEHRLRVLCADPDLDGVYGLAEQFVSPELSPEHARRFRFDPTPTLVPSFLALLMRRALMERVGPLDATRVIGSNIDWYARAQSVDARFGTVRELVGRRRIHGNNVSLTAKHRSAADLLAVARASRRRQASAEPSEPE